MIKYKNLFEVGLTDAFVILRRKSDGYVKLSASDTWEAYSSSNLDLYDIPLSGGVSRPIYYFTVPTMAAVDCVIEYHRGTPASNFILETLAEDRFIWDGSAEVDAYSETVLAHAHATGAETNALAASTSASSAVSALTVIQNGIDGNILSKDLVKVCPKHAFDAGVADWGGAYDVNVTWHSLIMFCHQSRIKQAGTVLKVKFKTLNNLNYLTNFQITVWRRRGSTSTDETGNFDRIGITENLVSRMVVGTNELVLTNPIYGVKEGDFYGTETTWSQHPTDSQFAAVLPSTMGETGAMIWDNRNVNGVPATENVNYGDYGVTGYNQATTKYYPIELYMKAPDVVPIGTSITSGWDVHYSYDEQLSSGSTPCHVEASFVYQLGKLLNKTVQNRGIGGEHIHTIAARLAADAVALKPKYIVMEGGTNDYTHDNDPNPPAPSEAQCDAVTVSNLASFETMIQACIAAHIIPVVMGIPPRNLVLTGGYSYGSPTQMMQAIDDCNAGLKILCSDYGAIYVDTMAAVGKFRTGGDAGNLWDIKDDMSGNGLHFSITGMLALAHAVAQAIREYETTRASLVTVDAIADDIKSYLVDGGRVDLLLDALGTSISSLNDISAADVKTALEAAGSHLALIKTQTDKITDQLIECDSYIDKSNPAQYQIVVHKKGDANTVYSRKDWKDSAGAPITGETKAVYSETEPV